MKINEAIRKRRTHKDFNGTAVTREQLKELLELATWAPNHRMSEPWRFYVVPHEKIPDYTRVVLGAIGDDEHAKLLRRRDEYARRLPKLGGMVAVYREPNDRRSNDVEELAACACAVQNLMLAATGMDIGSFWSTGRVFNRPSVRSFLGVSDGLEPVAMIWLGHPTEAVSSERTPSEKLTTWVD